MHVFPPNSKTTRTNNQTAQPNKIVHKSVSITG